jgi:hypothetical protein
MARRPECAAISLAALIVATPAYGETTLACKGVGTITNFSGGRGANQSVAVDVDFTLKFDEAARTLSARVPNVDYLRRIRLTNGVAVAEEVSFTDQEITAKFPHEKSGVMAAILTAGISAVAKPKIPPLVIDRLTGAFTWGPHSGQCSPFTPETTKKF